MNCATIAMATIITAANHNDNFIFRVINENKTITSKPNSWISSDRVSFDISISLAIIVFSGAVPLFSAGCVGRGRLRR